MKLMKKFMKKSEGFTLVELIVVIAILAILAGVAVPVYSGYIKKAHDAAAITELDAILTAANAANAVSGEVVAITLDKNSNLKVGGSGDKLAKDFDSDFCLFYDADDATGLGVLTVDVDLAGTSYEEGAYWTEANGEWKAMDGTEPAIGEQTSGNSTSTTCTHSYTDEVTAPTCGKQGYTTHTCSACGDSYVDTYVTATGEHVDTTPADNVCDVCNTSLSQSPSCIHTNYKSEWTYDTATHWHACNDCAEGKVAEGTHTYESDICTVCGRGRWDGEGD